MIDWTRLIYNIIPINYCTMAESHGNVERYKKNISFIFEIVEHGKEKSYIDGGAERVENYGGHTMIAITDKSRSDNNATYKGLISAISYPPIYDDNTNNSFSVGMTPIFINDNGIIVPSVSFFSTGQNSDKLRTTFDLEKVLLSKYTLTSSARSEGIPIIDEVVVVSPLWSHVDFGYQLPTVIGSIAILDGEPLRNDSCMILHVHYLNGVFYKKEESLLMGVTKVKGIYIGELKKIPPVVEKNISYGLHTDFKFSDKKFAYKNGDILDIKNVQVSGTSSTLRLFSEFPKEYIIHFFFLIFSYRGNREYYHEKWDMIDQIMNSNYII